MREAQRNDQLKKSLLDIIGKYHEINDVLIGRVDTLVETIVDDNQLCDLKGIMSWFYELKDQIDFSVRPIPLNDVVGWGPNRGTGNIEHEKGEFFSVIGVRVSTTIRERKGGWDQPMIDQGTKSSLVGLLRKPINGIPHYLIEAKAEPGNFGTLQLSPTLQVTFSNLLRAHEGRKPNYAEYFEELAGTDGEYVDVLKEWTEIPGKIRYRQWLPEDGGRFFKKRILFKIVDLPPDKEVPLRSDNFIWLTLFQMKELLCCDNIINPHLRSLISCL